MDIKALLKIIYTSAPEVMTFRLYYKTGTIVYQSGTQSQRFIGNFQDMVRFLTLHRYSINRVDDLRGATLRFKRFL